MAKQRAVATRWEAIPAEDVRKGVRRRAFGSEDVILVMNEIEPEMEPAPHAHDGFDQMALIISGRAIYHIGDDAHHVGPGSVMLIPAGETHWIEPDGDERIENLDVFAPARTDFLHLLTWMESAPGRGRDL
jgi:quercetin dioxygenase-like cupin family protein